MTSDSTDLERRWMDGGSGVSPELQVALRALLVEPEDAARIAGLEARLGPLLGAAPQPDLPSDAALAGGAAGKLGALLLVAVGLALGVRAGVRPPAGEPAGAKRSTVANGSPLPKPLVDAPSPHPVPSPAAPAATSAPTSVAKAAPPASVHRDAAGTTSVAEEARLLQIARGKVQDSPEEALVLLVTHQRRYPRSMLGDERELFTIQALVRAGRVTEASDRLTHFRVTRPTSPYLAAATRAVDGGAR